MELCVRAHVARPVVLIEGLTRHKTGSKLLPKVIMKQLLTLYCLKVTYLK